MAGFFKGNLKNCLQGLQATEFEPLQVGALHFFTRVEKKVSLFCYLYTESRICLSVPRFRP